MNYQQTCLRARVGPLEFEIGRIANDRVEVLVVRKEARVEGACIGKDEVADVKLRLKHDAPARQPTLQVRDAGFENRNESGIDLVQDQFDSRGRRFGQGERLASRSRQNAGARRRVEQSDDWSIALGSEVSHELRDRDRCQIVTMGLAMVVVDAVPVPTPELIRI